MTVFYIDMYDSSRIESNTNTCMRVIISGVFTVVYTHHYPKSHIKDKHIILIMYFAASRCCRGYG